MADSTSDESLRISKDKIQKFLPVLRAQYNTISSFLTTWDSIEEFFKSKEAELDSKILTIKEREKDLEELVRVKESGLKAREIAVSKVERAIEKVEELERKEKLFVAKNDEFEKSCIDRENFLNEKERKLIALEARIDEKEREKLHALDIREKDIERKESAAFQRVQELKEAALAAVSQVKAKHDVSREFLAEYENETGIVAHSNGNGASNGVHGEPDGQGEPYNGLKAGQGRQFDDSILQLRPVTDEYNRENSPKMNDSGNGDEGSEVPVHKGQLILFQQITPRSEIITICKAMNSLGLMNFMLQNQIAQPQIDDEIGGGMGYAPDPCFLVLNAFENSASSLTGAKSSMQKKCFHVYVSLLKGLSKFLKDVDLQSFEMPPSIKAVAKNVAERWLLLHSEGKKNKMNVHAESEAILRLLHVFDIIPVQSAHKIAALLTGMDSPKDSIVIFRTLGLNEEVPTIVNAMIQENKQLFALYFAHEFGTLNQLDIPSLIAAYLEESHTQSCITVVQGTQSLSSKAAAKKKEAEGVQAALECIKDCKLDNVISTTTLKSQWEKIANTKREDPSKRMEEHPFATRLKRRRSDIQPSSNTAGPLLEPRSNFQSPPPRIQIFGRTYQPHGNGTFREGEFGGAQMGYVPFPRPQFSTPPPPRMPTMGGGFQGNFLHPAGPPYSVDPPLPFGDPPGRISNAGYTRPGYSSQGPPPEYYQPFTR